jgi:HAD superfamily hydrolase (TIGR01509 family)
MVDTGTRFDITHVICDMDGLLLDTESIYTEVQQQIASAYGRTFTWELKAKMMGRKAIEASRTFVKELDIEDKISAEEVLERREKFLDEMFVHANLLPGAERLLRHLHQNNIPVALATSSHRRHYELKTTKHRDLFDSVFEHVTTGDAVTQGKPNPEIFLHSMNRFSGPTPAPSSCLVLEDAPSGVRAAKNAGMVCLMVPDPNLPPSDAVDLADVVLSSLEEIDLTLFGLPPFES